MSIISWLATIVGIAMSLANIPQAYRIFKRKSASDLSILTYSIFFVGSIIWFIYGLKISNLPIVYSYGIGTLSAGAVVVGWIMYR